MNVLDRPLVEAVAQRLRAAPGLIEKDWHVTRALGVLAALDHGGAIPAFGGGTSLSKGWGPPQFGHRLQNFIRHRIERRDRPEYPLQPNNQAGPEQ
jgi:hypothetical protein